MNQKNNHRKNQMKIKMRNASIHFCQTTLRPLSTISNLFLLFAKTGLEHTEVRNVREM